MDIKKILETAQLSPEQQQQAEAGAQQARELAYKLSGYANYLGAEPYVLSSALAIMLASLMVSMDGVMVPMETQGGQLVSDEDRINLFIEDVKLTAKTMRLQLEKDNQPHDVN